MTEQDETIEDQGQEETKEQTFHYDSNKMGMVPDDDADDSTEVESSESSGESDSTDESGNDGSGEKEVSAS